MLSRFANIRSQGTAKCVVPMFQRITAVHTSAPLNEEDFSKKEFPPATSKRDFVNYPRLIMRNERPPVRLGFIPESWFMAMYPKTGYTGPYVLLFTVGTYLLSKEKLVMDEAFMQAMSVVIVFYFVTTRFGKKITGFFQKFQDEKAQELDAYQNIEKESVLAKIKGLEQNEEIKKVISEATLAKKEFVLLQMEIAYRERIAETFKTIKNRLDCIAALENAERRSTHKNLIDYVLRNVNKGITPELEKNVLQDCIGQLNALAAKA